MKRSAFRDSISLSKSWTFVIHEVQPSTFFFVLFFSNCSWIKGQSKIQFVSQGLDWASRAGHLQYKPHTSPIRQTCFNLFPFANTKYILACTSSTTVQQKSTPLSQDTDANLMWRRKTNVLHIQTLDHNYPSSICLSARKLGNPHSVFEPQTAMALLHSNKKKTI